MTPRTRMSYLRGHGRVVSGLRAEGLINTKYEAKLRQAHYPKLLARLLTLERLTAAMSMTELADLISRIPKVASTGS
jgi:hypothetical protein